MEAKIILNGKNSFVDFLISKGYPIQNDYYDSGYSEAVFFTISGRKLLAVVEITEIDKVNEVKNHFLIERGISYCVIITDKKIIFFRNFGEGRYFLYSERTQDKISKLNKLNRLNEKFDILFHRQDISGEFYNEFRLKRDLLARSIKNHFDSVEKYLLSQKIFDRIFFTYFLCHKGIIRLQDGKPITGDNLFKLLIEKGDFVENLQSLFYYFNSTDERVFEVGNNKIKIPYLNGGLFRPNDIEDEAKFGLTKNQWKEIFNFLDKYHWIIEEDIKTAIQDAPRVLTPEILGHVYERSVVEWENFGIRTAAEDVNKQITARKKKGVYYTPYEITSYIVDHTIIPKILSRFGSGFEDIEDFIENASVAELEEALESLSTIRILDPACGSGAFLIRAADLLFQIKIRIFTKLGIKPDYYKVKLNIITENIFGVDILKGAIEITKLRLWLWLVVEYKEDVEIHALPNIEYNIRVGNSLIGWVNENLIQIPYKTPLTDEVKGIFRGLIANSNTFSERKKLENAQNLLSGFKLNDYISSYSELYQIYRMAHGLKAKLLKDILETVKNAIYSSVDDAFLIYLNTKIDPNYSKKNLKSQKIDESNYASLNPFHWKIDFWHIISDGGFDVIIGNPPYNQKLAFTNCEKKLLQKLQPQNVSNMNIAAVFMERSKMLLKNKSFLGLIVPKSLTFSKSWISDRNRLLKSLRNLADVSRAWKEVLLEQVIYVIKKETQTSSYEGVLFRDDDWKKPITISKKSCDEYGILLSSIDDMELKIADGLKSSAKEMGQFTKTFNGVPYQSKLESTGKYPAIGGKQINRYAILGLKGYFNENSFNNFQEKISEFNQEKIVSQRIIAHIQNPVDHIKITSTLDLSNLINVNTVSNTILTKTKHSLKKFTLLLNSKILNWYAYLFIFNRAIRSMDFYDYYVSKLPIPDNSEYDGIIESIADYLLFLNQYNQISSNESVNEFRINDMIEFFSNLADYIVFELYLKNILNTKMKTNLENLTDINYDEWAKLEANEKLEKEDKKNKTKMEITFLNDITKTFKRLSTDNKIKNEINLIKSHKWVKIIQGQ